MIITITSDFGLNDWYVGCMKGMILKINPRAVLVDITHNCRPQDISSGAYILSNSDYYPENTVHLAVIDPGVGSDRHPIIVKLSNNQIYVLPNNGLLTLLLQKLEVIEAYILENPEFRADNPSNTFHGRDIFAPAAAYASLGVKLSQFGSAISSHELVKFNTSSVVIDGIYITGEVVYIDTFGNLITNVHGSCIKGNIIGAEVLGIDIENIGLKYCDAKKGERIVMFSSENYIEISVNQGNAALELSADIGTQVKLRLNH